MFMTWKQMCILPNPISLAKIPSPTTSTYTHWSVFINLIKDQNIKATSLVYYLLQSPVSPAVSVFLQKKKICLKHGNHPLLNLFV